MSVPITLAYLSTNQPDKGGVSIKATSVAKCVSFNYIMFPGNNIVSTPPVQNSFINRTLNVGSDGCELIESSDGFVYHLFISKTEMLCTSDYFLVVSGLQLDGTQTPYQAEPLPLPLTPDQIIINERNVLITRNGGDYFDATITILFEEIVCNELTDVISYIVAVQYLGGGGNWHFVTQSATYEENIGDSGEGGVQVQITSEVGVDDAYVAIQGVRTVVSGLSEYKAIGELSETILAEDTEVPQPPTDLSVVYVYNTTPPTATLSWVAPTSAAFTDVTGFQVYRSVNGATAVALEPVVPYVRGVTDYEYIDEVPIPPFDAGDELTYYVVSINEPADRESAPSNPVTIVLVAVSSAPLNFNAVALQESETLASISSLFQNPTDVEGDTEGAYFVVNVYDSSAPIVVVATQNIPYDGGSAYEANFNNIAFSAFYNLECYLVTTDPNTDLPLEGASATITDLPCGYAPLIYKINGSTDLSLWTQINEITSLEVISFTTLLSGGAKLLAIDSDVPKNVHWKVIGVIPGVVTTSVTIPDIPYEPFAGAYRITYSNIPDADFFAVGIYVANRNGDSNKSMNGPFNSGA